MKLLLLFSVLIWFSGYLFSQGEGNNWYFGSYAGLSFSTNPPTILNDGHLTTSEGCASVSGKDGALVFYTDGRFVWDANHTIMPNGNGDLLGDPSSTQSAVVCPKPGTYNYGSQRYDGYFIVTIDFVSGANGVRFTEIDMNLNGGMGDVVVTNKNIHLFGTTTIEGANVAKHENGCDYWIIGKPVGNNQILTYQITTAGVNLTPIVNATGPILNAGWGSIKVSPNGKLIGIASAGSGVNRTNVYDFDNATGIITHRYSATVGRYSLEFSPNSNVLYSTGLSDPNIYQFDLTTVTQADFLASQTVIGTTANTIGYQMCGIQLAPNGKIYAALQGQPRLGAINNPNVLGVGCNYNDNEQSLVGVNTFSGTAMLSVLGLPAFPSFFVTEPVFIQSSYRCYNDVTEFKISDTANVNNIDWFWSAAGSPLPSTPSSTDWEPSIQYVSPGNYTVLALVHYPCFIDSIYDMITITAVNDVNLGNDTIICNGNSIILDAGSGYDYYSWHNGDNSQTFVADTSGQYIVEVANIGANLVFNGDFELGNLGFSSGYNYVNSDPPQGFYSISDFSDTWGGNCFDHTTGSGFMMEVDAACGTNGVPAGVDLWCQTVAVSPNTDYLFSVWAANASSGLSNANIGFFINGTQVGNTLPTTTATCNWQELTQIWNSGANISIDICIKELTMACDGSDFVLDDIFFAPLCKTSDTINVLVGEYPIVNFSIDDSCEYFNVNYTDISTISAPETITSWSWDIDNDGVEDYTIQNPSHSFVAGSYTTRLTITSALGCSNDTVIPVLVYPKPLASFNFIESCQYDTVNFTNTSIVNAPDTILTYEWAFDNGQTSLLENPSQSYTTDGQYTVQLVAVTNNNCVDTVEHLITVNPLPTATIFGTTDVCLNTTDDTYITFTGANATAPYTFTYSLNGGAPQAISSIGNTATILIPTNTVGTFNYELLSVVDGSSTLCAQFLSDSVSIIVRPLPEAQISGGDSLCLNTGNPMIEFVGSNGENPYTFYYTINGGSLQSVSSLAGQDGVMISAPSHQSGTFVYQLVSVEENGLGCSQLQIDNTTVVVHPEPISAFNPTPNVIMISSNVSQMVNTSTGAVSYVWSFGDGSSSSLVSPFHQFEIEDQESFTITLTSTSEFGCISIAVEEITVKEDELIYVPNTFTPDNNEFNPVFKPVISSGIDMYSYTMEIYDRWGERIFTTNDSEVGWDGTYNGIRVQDGTYLWGIIYKTKEFPEWKVLKGNVNLLR